MTMVNWPRPRALPAAFSSMAFWTDQRVVVTGGTGLLGRRPLGTSQLLST
jgi:hypothetical protein